MENEDNINQRMNLNFKYLNLGVLMFITSKFQAACKLFVKILFSGHKDQLKIEYFLRYRKEVDIHTIKIICALELGYFFGVFMVLS